jgi:hypothetical protein
MVVRRRTNLESMTNVPKELTDRMAIQAGLRSFTCITTITIQADHRPIMQAPATVPAAIHITERDFTRQPDHTLPS